MMSQNKIISDIFLPFQEHVNQEQDVREVRINLQRNTWTLINLVFRI